MRKRPVGLGHAMRVLALLDGVSPAVGCIEQLRREPFRHRLFIALARGRDDPADPERLPAGGAHLDRHLVGRATDFLPARMITFINFDTTRFPYFGSGLISRFSAL